MREFGKMKDLNDTNLIRLIKKGDKNAFREIYARYHQQLYFLAKKYLDDQKLAEDALQEIYLKLWKNRMNLDSSRSISAFLFTMMKNHVIDLLRKNSKKVPLERNMMAHYSTRENKTAEKANFNQINKIVMRGLDQLPDGKRQIFIMKMYEGFSNAEIADKLEISVNTVKSQLYHGTKFMRGYLQKHTKGASR